MPLLEPVGSTPASVLGSLDRLGSLPHPFYLDVRKIILVMIKSSHRLDVFQIPLSQVQLPVFIFPGMT